MNAVIIGRSNLVGRPLVQLLLNENATVTIAHSRTRDLADICKRADLLLAAVGQPEMVKGNWIKPGANGDRCRHQSHSGRPTEKTSWSATSPIRKHSALPGAITPVPGGVGQMTVACLLVNTLRAASAIKGLKPPIV